MSESNQTLKVANDIVAFIAKRGYEPGERLPSERDLTERFAVGRNAIREALVFLEASRFIERRRNSGIFLSPEMGQVSVETLVLSSKLGIDIDPRTIVECMEVRKILELQAIALACERRTDEDLAALDTILARSAAALDEGASIADLDYEFHMAIFRATHNDIFLRVVTPFYLMSSRRRDEFFSDHDNGLTSHAQHIRLVEAIRARDAAAAGDRMGRHIGRVEQHYLRQHGKNGETTSER